MNPGTIRIFCGADRSQKLPFLVLADSIRRHTRRTVAIEAIDNGAAPPIADPRCAPYTDFSFARFAIPALCANQGHAVYMDSDMLVFHDFAELWDTPMDGAAIAIERGSRTDAAQMGHARNRHAAVMLMDCAQLPWDVAEIVHRLGTDFDYNALMSLDPLLLPGEMRDVLPVGWNDLDRYAQERTRNLHFTEIRTQPWVSTEHPHGGLWVDALRRMLSDGAIAEATLREEVALGFARPSLLVELGLEPAPPGTAPRMLAAYDKQRRFVAHHALLARFAERKEAIARLGGSRPLANALRGWWRRTRRRWRS